MKKLLIIAFITLSLVGCKTTHSVVKESLKTDLTIHADSSVSSNFNQHLKVDSTVFDNSVLTDNSTEVITQTNYALPDSAGKQFIISTTRTERTNDKLIHKAVKTTVNTDNATKKQQTATTTKNTNSKQELKSDSKTTSTLIPWWVYLIPFVLAGLIYAGFKLWKITSVSTWIKRLLKIN